MITWGISANSHNAALAVIQDGRIEFASDSERFSGRKNDPDLDHDLVAYARQWGEPDQVVWYERPGIKTLRQLWAGQGWRWRENQVARYLRQWAIPAPVSYQSHHRSHAAAGYYTSEFDDACVLVIDAVGEFDTITIWHGQGSDLRLMRRWRYPNSIGLWYSAMTQRCGLRANEEEYILMGMSALGDPDRLREQIQTELFDPDLVQTQVNLHRGCQHWRPELHSEQDLFDIAAATQAIYESALVRVLEICRATVPGRDLVFMGGCALNCLANRRIHEFYDRLWIMPAPGDNGSAIGAVLSHQNRRVPWPGPMLGYDMGRVSPDLDIVEDLVQNRICGLARHRAEFGPRALGNRSLLADPRGPEIRDRVNEIKQRQRFRPFAPAVLAEHARELFELAPGQDCDYMQIVARCRRPDLYPAVVHSDGTSRVQTVQADGSAFRQLLEAWYQRTGCPMLLNTSLNIRGQPMVNNIDQARAWSQHYGVRVWT